VKVVILAGGLGTRLSEETEVRPKPMVEIGHRPILWHIMQHYAHYGYDDFIVCLGYRGEYIKRYFAEDLALSSDMVVDFRKREVRAFDPVASSWRVTLVDTGFDTETAGRMLKIRSLLDEEPFMMTYGDGVSDVDLDAVLQAHRAGQRLATVTAVRPTARFGQLDIVGDAVRTFEEKPQLDAGWVNGGYFVLEPGVFDYIPGDVDWAREPMEQLAMAGQLSAYRHEGFWQCMDTLRDKNYLAKLWTSGEAPWMVWAADGGARR
jgi:glucose-1-phosphate cytidylyltransferase